MGIPMHLYDNENFPTDFRNNLYMPFTTKRMTIAMRRNIVTFRNCNHTVRDNSRSQSRSCRRSFHWRFEWKRSRLSRNRCTLVSRWPFVIAVRVFVQVFKLCAIMNNSLSVTMTTRVEAVAPTNSLLFNRFYCREFSVFDNYFHRPRCSATWENAQWFRLRFRKRVGSLMNRALNK